MPSIWRRSDLLGFDTPLTGQKELSGVVSSHFGLCWWMDRFWMVHILGRPLHDYLSTPLSLLFAEALLWQARCILSELTIPYHRRLSHPLPLPYFPQYPHYKTLP